MIKSRLASFAAIILGLILTAGCQKQSQTAVDKKVARLLAEMTLEEKVGQMTQLTLAMVSKDREQPDDAHQIDPEKLHNIIVKHHVGSILNVDNNAYTPEHWHKIISQIQRMATEKTRLGIPVLYGIDAIHGANYTLGATIFPQSIAMAATRNRELVRREAEITALETRACGIPWNFNPVLGLARHALWSRNYETYGEDPYLAAELGAEYVRGSQGPDIAAPDKLATCAKHYIGYSLPFTGHDRTPAWIPERMLREIFVYPFKKAIDAGAVTVMANSSEINGVPVHSSYNLLTELLREELGFKGLVVSDWNDIKNLHEREKVAVSQKEAVKMAVMAGVDMSMVPEDLSFYELLLELVNTGEVPQWRIDEAVSRILKLKYQLGLFENPYPDQNLIEKFASQESQGVSLQAAREAMTLLKNEDNLLPLSKDQKLLITGPCADKLSVMNGGWTITWQGDREDLYPQDKPTILEAIQNKLGAEKVQYMPGATFEKTLELDQVVQAARTASTVILCLGEPSYCETPGNINDLTLSESQIELVHRIAQVDIPLVLVITAGRPRLIRSIVDHTQAVLMAYLPGMEGGTAIAEVLFGEVNPSGKLPFTYPKYPNRIMRYDHKYSEITGENSYDVQYPFGHGLSYTTFRYSDLKLDKKILTDQDTLRISVTVENTGDYYGKESVELYLSDLYATITPAVRRLKRFTKIALEPNERKTLEFTLTPEDLLFIGRDNRATLEAGEFQVSVGDQQLKFHVQ